MKMRPSRSGLSVWRPENIAEKRLGLGALRIVATVVVKKWPPMFRWTCGDGTIDQL